MATGRLTDIVKARRESGEGVASSLAGGVKERLGEKFDPRRILPQGGLLTALFPKLRAYQSKSISDKNLKSAVSESDASKTQPLFESINFNTKIIAKNSMALPLIQKDTNLISQTLKKIVKTMQVKKKFVPITKTTPVLTKTIGTNSSVGMEKLENDDGKSFFATLIGLLTSALSNIANLVTKTLLGLSEKIVTGIVDGFKGLFRIAYFASSLLLGLLKPLLAIVFSKVGIGLILTAGIVAALYKFAPDRSELEQRDVDINKIKMGYATGALTTKEPDLVRDARLSTGIFYNDEKEYLKQTSGQVSPKDIIPDVVPGDTQNLSGTLAVGDDIASGLIETGKIDGDGLQGRNTSDVLKSIEDNLKEDKNYYRLKHVILSTGISNSVDMKTGEVNPLAYKDIEKQISKLKTAGAVVTVLGTGPHKAYSGIDDRLKKISELYGSAVSFRPIASAKDKLFNTSGQEFNLDKINPNEKTLSNLASGLVEKTSNMFNPNVSVGAQITPPSISPGQMDSNLAERNVANITSADEEPPPAPEQLQTSSSYSSNLTPNQTAAIENFISGETAALNNSETMLDDDELTTYLMERMKATLNIDHPDVLDAWKKQIQTWIGSQYAS
jgi:hypothetical protein